MQHKSAFIVARSRVMNTLGHLALCGCLLAGCVPVIGPGDYAKAFQPTLRPGENFRPGSEHHLTMSGDYGLPAGTYVVAFGCAGETNYRIDDRSGTTRHGQCQTTGVSNTASESGVVGPGTLAIAIVRGSIDVKLR